MVNEEFKKQAINMVPAVKNMSIPCISLCPVLSLSKNEWSNLIYMFLVIKEDIEKKIGSPIVMCIQDVIEKEKNKNEIVKMRESADEVKFPITP